MKTIVKSKEATHLLCGCGSLELKKLAPEKFVCEKCGSPTGGTVEGPETETVEVEG